MRKPHLPHALVRAIWVFTSAARSVKSGDICAQINPFRAYLRVILHADLRFAQCRKIFVRKLPSPCLPSCFPACRQAQRAGLGWGWVGGWRL